MSGAKIRVTIHDSRRVQLSSSFYDKELDSTVLGYIWLLSAGKAT